MYSTIQTNFSSLNFAGKKTNTLEQFPQGIGYPINVTAEYNGYTGTKIYNFPTTLKGENYPDITNMFEIFKNNIYQELDNKKNWLGRVALLKENFQTGKPWDTKSLQHFPGRDIEGNTQYAKYKGKIVSANYVSNNIYAQVMQKLGFSEKMSKLVAKLYSCGIVRLISKGKLPHKQLFKFSDPIEDQEAISSGYNEIKYKNPWANMHIDPSRPHPRINFIKITKQIKPFI